MNAKRLSRLTLLAAVAGIVMLGPMTSPAAEESVPAGKMSDKKTSPVKVRIRLENKTLTATLADNASAADFASLLPLTVTLENHAATEKIVYLPRKLSIKGAPSGSDPEVGDLAYYAPWGNLAIFYRDFRFSEGLIKLGKIDGDIQALDTPGRSRQRSKW